MKRDSGKSTPPPAPRAVERPRTLPQFGPLPDVNKTVQEIEALMTKLKEQRDELVARLDQVNAMLGSPTTAPQRPKNQQTLRELILDILKRNSGGMTKAEILEAVQKAGYEFYGQKPMRSVNVALYTKKNGFDKRVDASSGKIKFFAPGQEKPAARAGH